MSWNGGSGQVYAVKNRSRKSGGQGGIPGYLRERRRSSRRVGPSDVLRYDFLVPGGPPSPESMTVGPKVSRRDEGPKICRELPSAQTGPGRSAREVLKGGFALALPRVADTGKSRPPPKMLGG